MQPVNVYLIFTLILKFGCELKTECYFFYFSAHDSSHVLEARGAPAAFLFVPLSNLADATAAKGRFGWSDLCSRCFKIYDLTEP